VFQWVEQNTGMYNQRVKIFISFYALLLLVMVLRLAQMQLLPSSDVHDSIDYLKRLRGHSQQTKSIRGRILDRHGEVLAADEAVRKLYADYGLTCYEDSRVRQALRTAARQKDRERQRALSAKADPNKEKGESLRKVEQQIREKNAVIKRLLAKCPELGVSMEKVEHDIQRKNNQIWDRRLFNAWNRHCKSSQFHQDNKHRINSVWVSEAKKDFARVFVDPNERIRLTAKSNTITDDLIKPFPLITLDTDDHVLAAQLAFLDVDDIEVRTEAVRRYHFKNAAAHTIGWIGSSSGATDPFAEDRHRRYLHGELVGRDDGVEYVCDAVLRGSRGERFRDIDRKLQHRAKTEHGRDVQLTLDIRLQQRIERFLAHEYPHAPHCDAGFAAVVLDVQANEILALVSLPTFDPALVRSDYDDLVDPNKNPLHPLRNRAINKVYPPGSVAKPLVAVAGLESGSIKATDVIGCPDQEAPSGWPNCLMFKLGGGGHDALWPDNNARNAIKGSCNIYFSHLANRIDPKVLQQWFFRFGYGRQIQFNYPRDPNTALRWLNQAPGQISSKPPPFGTRVTDLEQIPELKRYERPNAGIGQASIRVTPLQVANSMATLARFGVFKHPRLFKKEPSSEPNEPLGLSEQTLRTVTDGLDDVVNEENGTAHTAFGEARQSFKEQGVRVYGKTGSTEDPEHAWFAGFARDFSHRCLAIAVLVEGGRSGARDATPLARDIIQFCITHKYLGHD
jgi:penicillin-binding protein 2